MCHYPYNRDVGPVNPVGLEQYESSQLLVWGAWWACALTRMASAAAYDKHRRATGAQHVIEEIGAVMELLCPTPASSSAL